MDLIGFCEGCWIGVWFEENLNGLEFRHEEQCTDIGVTGAVESEEERLPFGGILWRVSDYLPGAVFTGFTNGEVNFNFGNYIRGRIL